MWRKKGNHTGNGNKPLYKQPASDRLVLLVVLFGAVIVAGWVLVFSQPLVEEIYESPNLSDRISIVTAVGDIACSPTDKDFNAGKGSNNRCQQAKVAKAMAAENPDSVLLLGDIQYSRGTYSEFKNSFVPAFKNLTMPMYIAAGNHDWQEGNLDGYKKAFTENFQNAKISENGKTYFSANLADWKLLVLDTDCEYVGGCDEKSDQYKWLESELDKNTNQCTLAIWHHPRLSSGGHSEQASLERSKHFWDKLIKSKAEMVLTGHDHNYARYSKQNSAGVAADDGIRQFIVGTGGLGIFYEFKNPLPAVHEAGQDDQYGYLRLTLKPSSYSWEFKNLAGQVLDSGADTCR